MSKSHACSSATSSQTVPHFSLRSGSASTSQVRKASPMTEWFSFALFQLSESPSAAMRLTPGAGACSFDLAALRGERPLMGHAGRCSAKCSAGRCAVRA